MDETQLSAETLAPLDDSERFDWLRLLRCENIGPRTFQVLLSRHGSAGAALAALPALMTWSCRCAGRSVSNCKMEMMQRSSNLIGPEFCG
jgi:predicted Rossmann fold nucleotide-binding protein DprA/Smf involved in DNA uptake